MVHHAVRADGNGSGEVLGLPPDCHYDTAKEGTVTSSIVWHCGKCVLAMKTWCFKPQADKFFQKVNFSIRKKKKKMSNNIKGEMSQVGVGGDIIMGNNGGLNKTEQCPQKMNMLQKRERKK